MRKALLSLAFLGAGLPAQELSQRDRDFTLSYLHATCKQLIDAVAGLSEAQWKFKPADDKWSVAEVVEHLVLTERGLFGLTQKTAMAPAVTTMPANKATDEAVHKNVPSRAVKVKAPEMFVPTGRFGVGEPELVEFKKTRDATIAFTRDTKIDLRSHIADSPLGPTDCVQWLQFIAAHNERHLGQIAEIKTDAKYPK